MARDQKKSKGIATNRRAFHEYEVIERFEAGIVLTGTEVRSLRDNGCQLTDCYALIRKGECWLLNLHIPPYRHGGFDNGDPDRKRKLLLHAHQIEKLARQTQAKGYTIVPLSLYFKDGRVKAQIALARGKKEFDKRQALREEQDKREAQRVMRYKNMHARG